MLSEDANNISNVLCSTILDQHPSILISSDVI
ncbi:hypothetical protein A2U01_0078761, partial [Trifolium medium]|nr:hypothetical protein [Trifolium medium]